MKDERSSTEIRQDIERTRAEMDETVDALERRLSPGQVFDEAWQLFRREGRGAGDVVRDHPVPLALMGLGVAWLAVERATADRPPAGDADRPRSNTAHASAEGRRGPYLGDAVDHGDTEWAHNSPSFGDRARDVGRGAKDALVNATDRAGEALESAKDAVGGARHATSDAGDRAGELAGQVRDGAHRRADQVRDSAQERARQVKHGFEEVLDRSPLTLGAISFGLGLATGLAVPSTPWEDKHLGRTSDALKEGVREAGGELAHEAGAVASETASAIRDEITTDETRSSLHDTVDRVKDAATDAARRTADQQGLTGDDMSEHARQIAAKTRDAARSD